MAHDVILPPTQLPQLHHQNKDKGPAFKIGCQDNSYHPYNSDRTARNMDNLVKNSSWMTLNLTLLLFFELWYKEQNEAFTNEIKERDSVINKLNGIIEGTFY